MGASYLNNGGGQRPDLDEKMFMMFAPAEHTDSVKKRKEMKRREKLLKKAERTEGSMSPRSRAVAGDKSPSSNRESPNPNSSTTRRSSTTSPRAGNNPSPRSGNIQPVAPKESRQDTPPSKRRPPTHSPGRGTTAHTEVPVDDDDVWYAKWWMFCFPDMMKNLAPKR